MFKGRLVYCLVPMVICLSLVFLFEKGRHLDDDPLKIGVSYMTLNNDFYKTLNAEIEKTMSAETTRFFVRDAELDASKQSQQIDFFVKQQVDILVVNPVDSHSPQILASLKRARTIGIRIIVVDSPISSEAPIDVTIVSDNYQAGVLLAEDLLKTVSEANLLILKHQNALSARERIQGFLDTIVQYPAYKVVAERETSGQTEESMAQVLAALQNGPSFDVVLSLNDQAALGALAALEDQRYSGRMLIYGVDGSPDIKALLPFKNALQGSVAQSPIQMGQKVSEVIQRMASHQKYESNYAIPVQVLTRENQREFPVKGWQ